MTQAFNLSQLANRVNTSGQLDISTGSTGTLAIANGGTGLTSPGTAGNVLTSNGTIWTSAAGGGYAGFSTVVFEASGTWTVPSGITRAVITCMGGGGGGGTVTGNTGGSGGFGMVYITGLSGTYTVTVGAGGASGASGGTSSFGSIVSCTGGGGGGASPGAMGTATISSGTAIQNGSISERYNDRGNAELQQFGWQMYNPDTGTTAANTWTKGQKCHPGIAGTGSTTAGNRKGGFSGLVMIEY
jgi:hypothetical protein